MNSGSDARFMRAVSDALDHLSATSPLPVWVFATDTGVDHYVLQATDPAGVLTPDAPLPSSYLQRAASSVIVPVGRRGNLIGLSSAPTGTAALETLRTNLILLARLLDALGDTDERHTNIDGESGSDPLTGLVTRHDWEQRVVRAEEFCAQVAEPAAILLIELDELKRFNELHGHSAGDEQLRTAGSVVRSALGDRMVAARVSGDRIGILAVGATDISIGDTERSIRQGLTRHDISHSIALGRRHPDTGIDGAILEANQHLAATGASRNNHLPDATEASAVANALSLGAIRAYFQPIVELKTGEVVAVEALARWTSRDGVREPDQFLRLVHQAGLAGALFERILDDGLSHLVEFRHLVPNLRLTVNFEFDTTLDTDLLAIVQRLLSRHHIPATALAIEFSERQTFELPSAIRRQLAAVAELGVQLVLDDFGTGYASLDTITRLPIHGVKLDRRFTTLVVDGDREPVVVKTMIAMALEAGLTITAEGVETRSQCDRLIRLGCRLGQGYLYALPQPADSLVNVLTASLATA
jgi:diguanylate cyclase (GGDEF)-like protein